MTLDQHAALAVSVKTAADLLDINPQLIYAAVNRGELPAKRIPGKKPGTTGQAIRINVDALRGWFDALDDARETT